jgi:putative inorganic carbon (hco3(-)) transporter
VSSFPVAAHAPRWGSEYEDAPPQRRQMPGVPPAAIAAIALLLAIVAGRFMADGKTAYGVAIVIGVCVGPLAFLNITATLALYVAVLFMNDAHSLSIGPNSVGVLLVLGWLGTLVTRSARPAVLREQPRLLMAVAAFALWLTLSVTWAASAPATGRGIENWLIAMLAFLLTVTSLHSPRAVAIVSVAFIVGAVISVLFGLASGGLSASAELTGEVTAQGGRFTGGGGDPNVQAAGYLVAMFLCAGCWSLARRTLARAGLVLAFVIVTVGFFATQSRGGLLALAAAAIAGLVLLPRQRKRLFGLAAGAGVGLAVVAAANPEALARMTNFGGGSSGRDDLWQVAWAIFKQHHWVGIGLDNFETVEPSYSLHAGTLNRVELISEHPHLVHNTYLQLLTETGVVGFALFLIVIVACLRASWVAAREFDTIGRKSYGDLARAALMAEIAMLTTQVFISDGFDWRLWILLGFGPVLLSLAHRARLAAEAAGTLAPPAPRRRRLVGSARLMRARPRPD